jgi:hypothetical protein
MKTLQNAPLAAFFIAIALLAPRLVTAADITSDTPPPAPRIENAPPHRDGYSWAPGYWEWNGRDFHWVSGTWIVERRNRQWVADHWDQIGNQWHYVRGHWEPVVNLAKSGAHQPSQ